MLRRSISSTLAEDTAQAVARSLMRSASTSRRSAFRTLESASPRICFAGLRITAAAYTGPASGPRPASSTPQTIIENLENRFCGTLGRVAAQEPVELGEALALAALRVAVAQQVDQRRAQRRRRGFVLQQLGNQLLAGEDVR